ncbi:MAG: 3-hydroxyacyl-CoA dehydrogenase NAD-binding domain-containing protein [Chitinophagales bacterium]|nr:3-hydroxyacyl-CoA dehydrogenase NAD-binding domain-containing protein [Chitinophagales bacterium]
MFRYEKDQDNIITITMDMQNRSANVINDEFGKLFQEALEKVTQDKDAVGVIITSAKSTFLAGADLESLYKNKDAQSIFDMAENLKKGFRLLETQGKPVVAAINGSALGGGYELALSCHRRIALNNPKTVIGLPEVTLGLLPGGGGTVRLPRLIGLQNSLPFLTEGKKLKPVPAQKAGLVDDIAESQEEMIAKAKEWIKANPKSQNPWDVKGFKIPGGDPRNPKIASVIPIVPAMTRKKTFGNYPAPEAIISSVVEGAVVDFDTASRIESRYFTKLATGKVANNMLTTFWFQLNSINAGASRPKNIPPQTTKKLGVIGAGMMGSGIAYVSAAVGIEVILKDATLEKAEFGKSYSEKLVNKAVAKGKMTKEQAQALLDRITPTADAKAVEGADLIIEAVFEDRKIKATVTQESEAVMDSTGVYASNTSTLPITGLATASVRPEKFIGIHFFSPVDKMPLVEIIKGEKTSDETLAKAFDYVKQIKKTPIVVNDSRGFYTSRVFSTYVLEGIAMLGEGQNAQYIEHTGLQAGMPVGPLALTDEVSLSLMAHIRKQTEEDLKAEGKPLPTHPSYPVSEKLLELNRPGKAAGAGFYEYPKDGGKKYLWPELSHLFPEKAQLPQQEVIDRLLFVQALDTVRCLEENVVTSVADANIGSIFGWGFSPFLGGTLQFINSYGLKEFIQRANELQAKYGDRFAVPQLLQEKAAKGEKF